MLCGVSGARHTARPAMQPSAHTPVSIGGESWTNHCQGYMACWRRLKMFASSQSNVGTEKRQNSCSKSMK